MRLGQYVMDSLGGWGGRGEGGLFNLVFDNVHLTSCLDAQLIELKFHLTE